MPQKFAEHGIDLTIPEEWTDREGHWLAADGASITVAFVESPIDITPPLLDHYCMDLRLDAARDKGGLIECEKSRLGVSGLIKRPRRDGTAGFAFEGLALAPVESGYFEFHVTHREGDISGDRESFVIEVENPATDSEGNLVGWQADPYGYRPSREPFFDDLFGHKVHPLSRNLSLFARSDDPKYDEEFPEHPLTRVRHWMDWLNRHAAIVETPFPHRKDRRFRFDACSMEAPDGFIHEADAEEPGEWFRRPTFNGRVSRLGLALHPKFPDACESVDRAESAVLREMDESHFELRAAPISYAVEIAGKPGVLTACETSHDGKDYFDISFFLPWLKASLEVGAVFESDDYERAMLNLEAVVPTIGKP